MSLMIYYRRLFYDICAIYGYLSLWNVKSTPPLHITKDMMITMKEGEYMLFYTRDGDLLCTVKVINGRVKLQDISEGDLYLHKYENYRDEDYYAVYFDKSKDVGYIIDSRNLDKYNFLADDSIKIFPIEGTENTYPYKTIRESLDYEEVLGIYYCLYKHNEFSSIN